jgi:hypothetical protein
MYVCKGIPVVNRLQCIDVCAKVVTKSLLIKFAGARFNCFTTRAEKNTTLFQKHYSILH